jgi:pimeloyl-ACP methyl ester carboxylesterase
MTPHRLIRTPTLDIALEESGPPGGRPVVLLHGYPYSPRGYDAVAGILAASGLRVLVPHLRGYGATRFRDAGTMRSGQQAVLARDLLDLLDALSIPRALLAGYDWGGRAACIVAALHPERCAGLVSCAGYAVQDIAAMARPGDPEQERRWWYQYYFHTERGVRGLEANRAAIAKLLWRLWSPDWAFSDAEFDASARDFDNPDHVAVVIHSYRHRFGVVAGDPAVQGMEEALAKLPVVGVPSIAVHGESDGVTPVASSAGHGRFFTGGYERRVFPRIGHNPPQEAPEGFARCVLDLAGT